MADCRRSGNRGLGRKPMFSSPLRSQSVQLLFESQPCQFPSSHRGYDLVLRGGSRLYVGAALLSAAKRLECQLQVSWYFHFVHSFIQNRRKITWESARFNSRMGFCLTRGLFCVAATAGEPEQAT